MANLIEIFSFLTVVLRGGAMAAQALVLGGFIFEAVVARPLAAQMGAGHGATMRVCRRLLVASALVLAGVHLIGALGKAALLRQSVSLSWYDTLGAGFVSASAVAALAALAIAIFVARGSRPWPVLAALCAVLMFGTTATSHAAARLEMREVLIGAVVLHQLAAASWIGGMPYFVMALNRCPEADATRAIGKRFSQLSMASVAVLFAAGLGMSLAYIDALEALHGTAYGAMLVNKVALFGFVLMLGFMNFRLVERLRRNPATPTLRLKRFAETEMGVGLALFFVAASLTSMPPAIDMPHDRLTLGEIRQRFAPHWPPRLTSPSLDELSNRTIAEKIIVAESVQRSTTAKPVSEGATEIIPDTQADIAWSEFNHNWAGIFVAAIGFLALAERSGKAPWARHWPLVFLLLAGFLFIRSDPENWPLGENSFMSSFLDPEVAQHRLITFLVIAFGMFEWAVRTGRLKNPRAAFVFPILTAVGGAFLLSHSHSLGNFKEELLIELSHLAIGTLGILGGWARWLELRLAKKDSAIASWTWRVCFVLIGLILLFYREA